ncbi:Uncharacterised protein [Vibrio cholerae]|nr:Uncharacterised protein [Vibrio cholerae]
MLNLNTRVHLNEVELTVFVQEFKGTSAAVADFDTRTGTTFTDELTHFFSDTRCGCFFHHFLVTALH